MRCRSGVASVAMAVVIIAAQPVHAAGIWKDILIGLDEAGFNFTGEKNFLSGGADLVVSRTFNGETLDFGATELTLVGTPRFQFSTGGRGLQVMDFSLSTANSPLSYTLVTDTGGQRTIINGNFLLDATASLNSFGWYDLNVDVSSRQTVTQDGRFSNDETQNDFDIGPIAVRGNIFADLLASITDPLFQALGVENIFASFSGAAIFQDQLDNQAALLLNKAQAKEQLTTDELAQLATITSAAAFFGLQAPDLSGLSDGSIDALMNGNAADGWATALVPEPASLLLLVGAAPLVLWRRRRR